MVKKECVNCNKYIPYCKLYGYFDKCGRPRVDKVCGCENEGSRCCKKGDSDAIFRLSSYYSELTAQRNDYEDCFDTMIEDFETVNCPYWKHIVGAFNILFDTSVFEEDEYG